MVGVVGVEPTIVDSVSHLAHGFTVSHISTSVLALLTS